VAKPDGLESWDGPPTRHGYKGGDLLGVVEHLDWLTDLGITAIYFNPIFWSASNHRYHTYDYYRVDPLLGGDDAFAVLLDACHARGIRVILDGVFNHASRGFFQFNDILENGRSSPWHDWFTVTRTPLNAYATDQTHNYRAWWNNPALPKFNTANPAVRDYLFGVAEYWTEKGIDGWRLDVPSEIKTRGFWEEFRTRVRRINPEAYLVGEIWGNATKWIGRGDRFDAAMNYVFTGKTLAFVAGDRIDPEIGEGLDYPLSPSLDAVGYGNAMRRLLALYPKHVNHANFNLLGSHDTPRALSIAGGDTAAIVLAILLLFTFPGAPCVYYGDEVGMEGGPDPGSRGAFPWDRPGSWNTTILEAYRSLIALRRSHSALRRGTYRPLPGRRGSYLYRFLRENEHESLLIIVNAGETPEPVPVPETGGRTEVVWGPARLGGREAGARILVPPRSATIIRSGS
jgi:glycosidase